MIHSNTLENALKKPENPSLNAALRPEKPKKGIVKRQTKAGSSKQHLGEPQTDHQHEAVPPKVKNKRALQKEGTKARKVIASSKHPPKLVRTLSDRELSFYQGSTRSIGCGAYGTIYGGAVKDEERGDTQAVVKEFYKPEGLHEELNMIKILYNTGLRNHKNIAYIYGSTTDNTENEIVLRRYTSLPPIYCYDEKLSKAVITALCDSITDMLKHNVRHNDQHAANILQEKNADGTIIVKIIDFGLLTQASEEEEQLLGLVDFKVRKEKQKKFLEVDSPNKSDFEKEQHMFQEAMLPYEYEVTPAIRFHPLELIHSVLDREKQFDPDHKKRNQIIDIIAQEQKLFLVHSTMRFIEKGGDPKQIEPLPEYIRQLLGGSDSVALALKNEAKKLAQYIKTEFQKLSTDLKETIK